MAWIPTPRTHRALTRLKRRFGPPPPPAEAPDRARELSRPPSDDAFVTGNGFAAQCRFVLNYDSLETNEAVDNNWWFCRSDSLEYFFARLAPRDRYVLFTHNSDRTIGSRFRSQLDDRRLVAWLAQNVALEHPKLHAIPIGLANPHWLHGDQQLLQTVIEARLPKNRLFDVSFNVETNPAARGYCLERTGLSQEERLSFEPYLRRLAQAYFCICPRGAGIDAHRMWEALAVGVLPVVTRSVLTQQHPDLPMIVLDDWSEFDSAAFTLDLYSRVWGEWTPNALRMDRYIERVRAKIGGVSSTVR